MAGSSIISIGEKAAKEIAGRLKLVKAMIKAPTGCLVKGLIIVGAIYIISPIDLSMLNVLDDAAVAYIVAYLIPHLFLTAEMRKQLMIEAGLEKA